MYIVQFIIKNVNVYFCFLNFYNYYYYYLKIKDLTYYANSKVFQDHN